MRPRQLTILLATLALGAALGLVSAWAALRAGVEFDAVVAGPWIAHPHRGGVTRDPYAAAATARSGETPFDLAEGVAFRADVDSDGAPLDGACVYRVLGPTPPARFWTLTVTDAAGRLIANPAERHGFTSTELERGENGDFLITLSPQARAGMWLPTTGLSAQTLTLRLYDTPVSAVPSAIKADDLPRIEKAGCS